MEGDRIRRESRGDYSGDCYDQRDSVRETQRGDRGGCEQQLYLFTAQPAVWTLSHSTHTDTVVETV